MKRWLFLIGLTVGICQMVRATPSTLIWIPSTDIQAHRTWHLGVDNYSTLKKLKDGKSFPFLTNPAKDLGLTYGYRSVEAGVDCFPGTDDPLFLNAKALLLKENRNRPGLAVGLYNVGTNRNTTGYNMMYVLVSKALPSGAGRVHLGYCRGLGKRHLFVDSRGNPVSRDMVMAGYDRQIDSRWWVGADFQSGKSAFGALNFGVAYSFSPNTSVIFGYDFYNDSGYERSFTTQLDINF